MSKPGHRSLVCLSMMHGGVVSFHPYDHPSMIPPENTVEMTLSLASGTFVLLVRLFFLFVAVEVPLARLRKENGK